MIISHQQQVCQMNNLVAKHAREFNKSHVMVDRKKSAKRGYQKHKGWK